MISTGIPKHLDSVRYRTFIVSFLTSMICLASAAVLTEFTPLPDVSVLLVSLAISALSAAVLGRVVVRTVSAPLDALWYSLMHAAQPDIAPLQPTYEHLRYGREMVSEMASLLYDVAMRSDVSSTSLSPTHDTYSLFDSVGQPLIAVDSNQNILHINLAAKEYLGVSDDQIGKPLVNILNMSFPTTETYESWLAYCKENKVRDTASWRRVRAQISGSTGVSPQFDLSASYVKNSASGVESVLTIFDQTERYSQDDQNVSFVSLAVHELRTPLTIMRGYIEVFEDELGPKLDPEMTNFMHKMNASAQQLTAFVGNILNVARVENNELELRLQEEEWEPILKSALEDLSLRARVHGKSITTTIEPGLPKVALDRVSIHEVVNNIIENAIKYGGNSNEIRVRAYIDGSGFVATDIQDFGVGIPLSVMPHLFEKFYRSHRSKGSIGGTGLGLYLSKAIITAHGGNLSVQSKEGEGSTFTFTLQPFSQVASEAVRSKDGIMRGAHGWIKNHNMYRQ